MNRRIIPSLALVLLTGFVTSLGVGGGQPAAGSSAHTGFIQALTAGEDELEPGPVPELSTETSTTVRNEDGTYTAKVASGPINYRDDSGAWVPISNDLVDAPGAAYAVENEANSYTASIPENPAATPVRFETDDAWVTMKLAGSDDVEPDVDGAEASFEDLVPAADEVSYQATDTGLKETITLEAAPQEPVSYQFNLGLSQGITPVLTPRNQIEFRDAGGAVQFIIPAPSMEDSATPEPAYSMAVTYSLIAQGAGWRLAVTPDQDWLSDEARIFPVEIDPSVEDNKGDQKDCWIQSDMPNASRCQNDYIRVGLVSGALRHGLLDFGVDSIPAGATIDNAELWLGLAVDQHTGNGGATGFSLYQPNKRWNSYATWNSSGVEPWNGGSSGAPLSTNSPVMGNSGDGGWKVWNVTDTVRRWRSTGSDHIENRGILIRQQWENASKSVGFISGTNQTYKTWRPILRINYTTIASIPSGLTVNPCSTPCHRGWIVAESTTPTLLVNANPDLTTNAYDFTVRNADDQSTVAHGVVSVGPGQRPAWQVPSGNMAERGSYELKVVASNSVGAQGSAWVPLTVNLPHAPDVPTGMTLSPCEGNCSSLVSTSTTPILTASALDIDSANVKSWFEVRTAGTGVSVAQDAGSDAVVAAAENAVSYQIPNNVVTSGTNYEFRVRLTDPEGHATYGPWTSFSIHVLGVKEPSALEVAPCAIDCSSLVTNSATPTLKVTNADSSPVDIIFDLSLGGGDTSHTSFAVAPGATATWPIPTDTVGSGIYQVRVGATKSGVTSWTPTRLVTIRANDASQTAFPSTTTQPIDPDATEDEFAEASRPYDPHPSSDGDDSGAGVTYTDAQRQTFQGTYVEAGTEGVATVQNLIRNFSPILFFDSEERYMPLEAETFLKHSKLNWKHECGDGEQMSGGNPRHDWLSNGSYKNYAKVGTTRDYTTGDPVCNRTDILPLWHSTDNNVRPRNSGGPAGASGMYLNLDNDYQDGQGFQHNENIYYRYVKHKYIGYYFLYGSSAVANYGEELIDHEGDWEMIWMLLDSENKATAVEYEIHGQTCILPVSDGAPRLGPHPMVYVGNHSHASYPAGYGARWDDDASGDGDIWYGADNITPLSGEDWYGYTGGWGQVGSYDVTTGPEGIDAYKGGPDYSADYCDA